MRKALLIGNGRPPLLSHIKKLRKLGWNYIIAADGGYNSLMKLKVEPNVVIGDFDSIRLNEKQNTSSIKFIKISRQNDTDMEKAVKFAVRNKIKKVILLAATGMRLDHTIGNLSIPLKFKDEIDISILTNYSYLKIIKGDSLIQSVKGETLSFIAFDKNVSFTSTGLKYKMDKLKLAIGYRESISNESSGKEFMMSVKGGCGYMIRDAKFVLRNALL